MSMAWHDDTLLIADSSNHRVVRWRDGDAEGKIISGLGVLGSSRPDAIYNYDDGSFESVAVASDKEVIWWQTSRCLWKIDLRTDTVEEVKFPGASLSGLLHVQCSRSGVYVLDHDGTRIVKIEDAGAQPRLVAGGSGDGPELNKFGAYCFAVGHDETMYISDFSNDRVLRWIPGAHCGEVLVDIRALQGSFSSPLGLCYTDQQQLYICYGWPGCSIASGILMWEEGESKNCYSVLDHFSAETVLFAGGALYASPCWKDSIIRFGPIPTLQF
mmetsp:Transcript_113245/g.359943  ORF Transcript_113245/g.359943 Transcript_113245/m.359943 type:complete len:271 (-) Transcript_113245:291-1103(-)